MIRPLFGTYLPLWARANNLYIIRKIRNDYLLSLHLEGGVYMSLIRLANSVFSGGAPTGRAKGFSLALVLASSAIGTNAVAQSDGGLLTVLNPTGTPPPIERQAMAPRPTSLDGKTIYLVDVTFNGGDLFLQEMQKWITVNMPEVDAIYRVKRGAYSTNDPELWQEIQAVDGVMVMAIGH